MSNVLPDYELPPLNEVVIGVQFKPLGNFTSSHLGLFWSSVRDRYPKSEDTPPLAHTNELPDITPQKDTVISFAPTKIIPRCWMISGDSTQLIQLQADRFLRNWRRGNINDSYPRYSKLIGNFRDDWNCFREFISKEKLGEIEIDQCELAYVNHIDSGIGWDSFGDLSGIFPFLRHNKPTSCDLVPEFMEWSGKYKMPNGQGRLHVDISPVFRGSDYKLALSMSLTVRGLPKDLSSEGQFKWYDTAHECIVKVFDEMISPSARSTWKKRT